MSDLALAITITRDMLVEALAGAGKTTCTTTPAEPTARTLLGVPATHGAPHHNAKEIKAGDFVAQVDKDGLIIRGGIAHRQGGDDICWDEPTGEIHCHECRGDKWGERAEYPCPTVATITQAPEGETHA